MVKFAVLICNEECFKDGSARVSQAKLMTIRLKTSRIQMQLKGMDEVESAEELEAAVKAAQEFVKETSVNS